MFWTRAILWKIIKVLEYLIGMVRYFPARKKIFFVPYLTRPHSLRHSFATLCIENGIDSKALSEILGHSSVKITLDIYVHSNMAQKKEYLNRLSI